MTTPTFICAFGLVLILLILALAVMRYTVLADLHQQRDRQAQNSVNIREPSERFRSVALVYTLLRLDFRSLAFTSGSLTLPTIVAIQISDFIPTNETVRLATTMVIYLWIVVTLSILPKISSLPSRLPSELNKRTALITTLCFGAATLALIAFMLAPTLHAASIAGQFKGPASLSSRTLLAYASALGIGLFVVYRTILSYCQLANRPRVRPNSDRTLAGQEEDPTTSLVWEEAERWAKSDNFGLRIKSFIPFTRQYLIIPEATTYCIGALVALSVGLAFALRPGASGSAKGALNLVTPLVVLTALYWITASFQDERRVVGAVWQQLKNDDTNSDKFNSTRRLAIDLFLAFGTIALSLLFQHGGQTNLSISSAILAVPFVLNSLGAFLTGINSTMLVSGMTIWSCLKGASIVTALLTIVGLGSILATKTRWEGSWIVTSGALLCICLAYGGQQMALRRNSNGGQHGKSAIRRNVYRAIFPQESTRQKIMKGLLWQFKASEFQEITGLPTDESKKVLDKFVECGILLNVQNTEVYKWQAYEVFDRPSDPL